MLVHFGLLVRQAVLEPLQPESVGFQWRMHISEVPPLKISFSSAFNFRVGA
jgi:hypothetical protein